MKLTLKMEFVIMIVLILASVLFQAVICYRQTQIQKSCLQMAENMIDLKMESHNRRAEYYDIMRALDIKLKTGELILTQEEVNESNN